MNVIISSIDHILNFGKANSLWPLAFGTSCCAIEMVHTALADYDISRFGSEIFRGSPRQADLLICAGTITSKMAPALIKVYNQMPEPKYVIAMGACAVSGGMFSDSYSVIQGIDSILPVDIYLPGCPPRPEALIDALIKLQNRIKTESITERKERLKARHVSLLGDTDDVEPFEIEYFGVDKI